jgi:hypothetical protein
MCAAAFGYLPPLEGALLQEIIDVAVILNALRALARPDDADIAARRTPGLTRINADTAV